MKTVVQSLPPTALCDCQEKNKISNANIPHLECQKPTLTSIYNTIGDKTVILGCTKKFSISKSLKKKTCTHIPTYLPQISLKQNCVCPKPNEIDLMLVVSQSAQWTILQVFFANIKNNIRKNIWSLHFYYLSIVITFLLSLERYLPIFLLKICRIWHCALRVKNTINSQILLTQKFFFELNITIKPIGKKKNNKKQRIPTYP